MVLPGHLAGGYLAASAVLAILHPTLSHAEINFLLIVGTLAGELPDIDLLFFYFERKSIKKAKRSSHRDYVTHAPSFWLVICVAIAGAGYAVGNVFTECLGITILAGVWSHFTLDSIEYGVRWLWPVTDKLFFLRDAPVVIIQKREGTLAYHLNYIKEFYIKNWTFYAEILVTIFAAMLLLSRI